MQFIITIFSYSSSNNHDFNSNSNFSFISNSKYKYRFNDSKMVVPFVITHTGSTITILISSAVIIMSRFQQ